MVRPKKQSHLYEREVEANLNYLDDLQTTLVASFESCFCNRFYVLRTTITFGKLGPLMLDIPVNVSK